MPNIRIGLGYDLHRTIAGRPLVLANITIPHDPGLDGHSDADVVLHALIDAGHQAAAGLPDVLARCSPTPIPNTKASTPPNSSQATMHEFTKTGYKILNTDIIVLAQKPKLSPYKPAMIKRLAELLQISESQINIKGKTGESVDAIGEEKAIACHCVVLIEK